MVSDLEYPQKVLPLEAVTPLLKYLNKKTNMSPDPKLLLQLVKMRMPFGKYKDRLICDLPVSYLEWFNNKGFPTGKLGMLLQTMHVIKSNGLEDILTPLKRDKFYPTDQSPDQFK